jgi:hypothetical protein
MKMKTNINRLKLCILALVLTTVSCTEKEDSIPNGIYSSTTNGANLRTISENQKTFNFYDTSSEWSVTVEEQDAKGGALFSEIKVYAAKGSGVEKFVKSISASTFSTGPVGLPRGTVKVKLSEALTALSLTTGQYIPSDKINMRLELILTDGRVFSSKNASTSVTGGGYYASPFSYSVQFFCPLANAADFNGNYKVVADAWADYNPDDIVPVSYVPSDGTYKFRILNTNNLYINNPNTSYYLVTIDPTNASVTLTSNQPLFYSPSTPATNVTGTGSVGSCTGDINLKLKFEGGYNAANQTFTLVKI